MDEGWTRWLMERYDFDFQSVYNPDVLAGELRDRYDVIILADIRSNQILDGFAKGSVPPRYEGGLGYEAIADRLALPLTTVQGRLKRARVELHRRLIMGGAR